MLSSYKGPLSYIFLLGLAATLFGCQTSQLPPAAQDPISIESPISTEQTVPVTEKPIQTQVQETDNILSILFIGNSYTFYNNLPAIFSELMSSGGYQVDVGQVTNGGWSLYNHLTSSTTARIISNGSWDFVVLQEQSVVNNPELGMFSSVESLSELIHENDAEAILFMTWGRRDGLATSGYPDYLSMQSQVTQNYLEIGSALGLTVAPVGTAWANVLGINPDQGLWDQDGSHPSRSGSYLAACVFYTLFTGSSPEGLEYLADLPVETAGLLQSMAAQTVLDEPDRWHHRQNH